MKKIYTLILFAVLYCGNAFAQNCTSMATSYDLLVVANTTLAPTTSPSYTQGYVCNGGVLIDSAMCCTRFTVVDSGGTMIVGPISYGVAYILGGGTFNGQGASNNWMVISEPGATVLNHTGANQACSTIVYSPTSCTMGISPAESRKPEAVLIGHSINFEFADVMNDVQIELVDVNGKVVKSEMMNQSATHSMDVSGLASGVYMYRVMQGEELIAGDKLVISE